jgi:hypothetical protein
MQPEFIERFKRSVQVTESCWVWTGSKLPRGYGRFYFKGKAFYAHRLALEIFKGMHVPADKVVMHACDNPSCCNPDHLSIGTQTDNMRDASNKGRTVNRQDWRGSANPKAKLTAEQIEEIKRRLAAGERPVDLAREFGVGRARTTMIRKLHCTPKEVG